MIRGIDFLIEKPADAMLLSTAGPGYTDGVDEDPAVSLHSGPIEIKRIGGKVCSEEFCSPWLLQFALV
jgi:hypothetical protein